MIVRKGIHTMRRYGFIGMGNMASALCGGLIRSGAWRKEQISAYAPNWKKLEENAGRLGFAPCESTGELLERSDLLILACKPQQAEKVLCDLREGLSGKALVSIALGWSYERCLKVLGGQTRIQFIMPNTPAMAGEGVFLFERENSLFEEERAELWSAFSTIGMTEELPASLMEIGGAVSGCGPAFIDMLMEAYGDAAVKYGLPRSTAYRIVARTVLGSAKLQLESGEHPGVLKDRVCSPGGTTIRGCAELENSGFRAACIRSIDAIMERR